MDFEPFRYYYLVFIMCAPRIFAACSVLLLFSNRAVFSGGLNRNGILFSLVLFVTPIADSGSEYYSSLNYFQITLILLKESIIGFVVGYVVNIPFWAFSSVGHLVDNQRGATIMESFNPMTQSPGSPLADLLTQTAVTLFLITGGFLVFFKGLVISYAAWPVASFMPTIGKDLIDFSITQFQWLMEMLILLGGPVLVVLFLSEFGLALISRFAPQLNVFILSMSVKSGVAIGFLCVYFGVAVGYFDNILLGLDGLLNDVFRLME